MLFYLGPFNNSGLVSGKEFLVLMGVVRAPYDFRPLIMAKSYLALRSCYLYYSFGLRHFIEWPDKTGLAVPEVHVLSGMMLKTTSVPSFF